MAPVGSLRAQVAEPSNFFESLYDVPIMSGLEEAPELALSFDKPDGRISQAGGYSKTAKEADIFKFYDLALVQMGWKRAGTGVYIRERERLELSVEEITGKAQEKQEGLLFVKFLLKPLQK